MLGRLFSMSLVQVLGRVRADLEAIDAKLDLYMRYMQSGVDPERRMLYRAWTLRWLKGKAQMEHDYGELTWLLESLKSARPLATDFSLDDLYQWISDSETALKQAIDATGDSSASTVQPLVQCARQALRAASARRVWEFLCREYQPSHQRSALLLPDSRIFSPSTLDPSYGGREPIEARMAAWKELQAKLATGMMTHPRLGVGSAGALVSPDVLRLIFEPSHSHSRP